MSGDTYEMYIFTTNKDHVSLNLQHTTSSTYIKITRASNLPVRWGEVTCSFSKLWRRKVSTQCVDLSLDIDSYWYAVTGGVMISESKYYWQADESDNKHRCLNTQVCLNEHKQMLSPRVISLLWSKVKKCPLTFSASAQYSWTVINFNVFLI